MEVKRWLQAAHIVVPDDWLEACIDFINSENQGNLNSSQLRPLVHEQWLESDLRELACPCLPQQVTQDHKYILNGFYALQMDSVVDVSIPLFSQLQKRKGTENDNVHVSAETQPSQPAWAVKSNRMLMLKLTDGVQDVQAMEYRPIPALSTEITPGAKLLVQGEVLCRLGVLMLTRDNVKLLGGEVESLLEGNDTENIITRILEENRNIDPEKLAKQMHHPKEDTKCTLRISQQDTANQYKGRIHTPNNQYQARQPMASNQYQARQLGQQILHGNSSTLKQHPQNSVPPSSKQRNIFSETMDFPDDDDDLLDSLDDRQLAKIEEQVWEEDIDYNAVMNQVENEFVSQNSTSPIIQSHHHTQNVPRNNSMFDYDSGLGFTSQLSRDNSLNILHGSNKGIKLKSVSNDCSQTKKDSNFGIKSSFIHENRGISTSLLEQRNVQPNQPQVQSTVLTQHAHVPPTFSDQKCGKSMQTLSVVNEQPPIKQQKNMVDLIDDDSSDFDLVSSTFDFTSVKEAHGTGSIGLHTPPFTYLSLTRKMLCDTTVITIKGYISTLTSKLEHNKGTRWTLSAKVNDGTAAVDMDLSDQMLTSLIGFSAAESLCLREVAKSDVNARLKLSEGMKQCQRSLISISCLLEVQFPGNGGRPCILSHRDLTMDDVCALKARSDDQHQ